MVQKSIKTRTQGGNDSIHGRNYRIEIVTVIVVFALFFCARDGITIDGVFIVLFDLATSHHASSC